jgi:uncharacterized protein (TIGR03086 family)
MKQRDLFLQADAALRSVIDRIPLDRLDEPTPAAWSTKPDSTLRDVLAEHARDEAWVPDVLLGRTIEDAAATYDGDLLGDDPIGRYDRINDLATAAVQEDFDPGKVVHLSYGDYPVGEYLEHISTYRVFQAWLIAQHVGLDFFLPEPLLDLVEELIAPQIDDFRAMGVFPPEIEPPAGADRETRLLCRAGYAAPAAG